MNKKITLPILFLFFLSFQNLTAIDLVKICITTQSGDPVGQVEFDLSGINAVQIDNDVNGCYQFEVDEAMGTFSLSLEKNINHSNGVDLIDLFMMRNGILGATTFTPFQLAASDINNSNAATTFDLVIFSKIILNDPNLTATVPSWKFFEPDLNPMTNMLVEINEISIPTPINGTTQIDIIGVKMGDLNLSADPSMFNSTVVETRSDDLEFKTTNKNVSIDEIVEVEVSMKNFTEMIGTQFTLEFDSDQLEFQDITIIESGDYSLESFTELSNEGIINILLITNSPEAFELQADDQLFSVKFKAKNNIELSEVITISSASTLAIAYSDIDESMYVQLVFEEETVATQDLENETIPSEIFPNPFQFSTEIKYNLKEANHVKLEILDVNGKVIETLVNSWQPSGEYNLIFTPMSKLGTGVYFSQLTVGENTSVKKLNKIQ